MNRNDEEADEMERIRAAVAAAVEASTLRKVAREVGMTPTAVSNFVRGSNPYRRGLAQLRTWYIHRSPAAAAEDVRRTLLRLLNRVPQPEGSLPEVVAAFERVHRRAGVAVPRWLDALKQQSRI